MGSGDVDAIHELRELALPGNALETLPEDRVRAPFDQPYGMREFHVKDPDGCLLLFGEAKAG